MTGRLSVAIVTPSLSHRGGTEKCLSWLAEGLAPRTDVTVFAGEVADTDVSGLRIRRLPMIMRPRLARYLSFLLANTVALGGRRLLRRPPYDVVLATGGDCVFSTVVYAHFCAAAWLEMIGREQIELPSATLRQRVRNLQYRLFLRLAAQIEGAIYRRPSVHRVVAVSEGTKRELVRHYGVNPNRVVVVPNMVDEGVRLTAYTRDRLRRQTRVRHGVPADAFVLLFVAAGDFKRKGLLPVLGALSLVGDPRLRLLVLGRDDNAYYEACAERLGVADRTVFAGFAADVAAYYAAADCFVSPSAYEAFSLASLEAAGAGLPLLVTRINGTEELVRDGENGFFVDATAESIASRLRLIIDDPVLRDRMASAAAETSQGFTRERVVEGILEAITGADRREMAMGTGTGR